MCPQSKASAFRLWSNIAWCLTKPTVLKMWLQHVSCRSTSSRVPLRNFSKHLSGILWGVYIQSKCLTFTNACEPSTAFERDTVTRFHWCRLEHKLHLYLTCVMCFCDWNKLHTASTGSMSMFDTLKWRTDTASWPPEGWGISEFCMSRWQIWDSEHWITNLAAQTKKMMWYWFVMWLAKHEQWSVKKIANKIQGSSLWSQVPAVCVSVLGQSCLDQSSCVPPHKG